MRPPSGHGCSSLASIQRHDSTNTLSTSCMDRVRIWGSELKPAWRPLFHRWIAVLMFINVVFGFNCGAYFVSMPAYVEKVGVSPDQTAYIYIIGACSNLATRLGVALIGKIMFPVKGVNCMVKSITTDGLAYLSQRLSIPPPQPKILPPSFLLRLVYMHIVRRI